MAYPSYIGRKSQKTPPVPESAEDAQSELNAMLGLTDDSEGPDSVPENTDSFSEEPVQESVPRVTEKKGRTEHPKASAGTKTNKSKQAKASDPENMLGDSKLRKEISDPTAQRIGARVPKSLYMDLIYLKGVNKVSIDYSVTTALCSSLYRKYACPCGATFSIEAENMVPIMCPVCGAKNIRRLQFKK